MKSTKLMQKSILVFFALGLCFCGVTELQGEKQGKIYIQKGPSVDVDLKKMFDVSSVVYPLTITSTPNAELHDFTHPLSKIRHRDQQTVSFTATTRINQSTVILFIRQEFKICESSFSNEELSENTLNCFELEKTSPNQQPDKTNWNCEDAVYETSISGYFVVCRGKKTVQNQKE